MASPGDLTKITIAKNIATPNATVPVISIITTSSESNIDVALSPKGTGSILAQVPDNGTGGGNKRGNYAVDLQMQRLAATGIASGANSCVIGQYNTASGAQSFAVAYNNIASGGQSVSMGSTNTASGTASVAIGTNNNSSNTASVALGGSNTASGLYSSASGFNNTASGFTSWIPGGEYATTRGLWGGYAWASSRVSVDGDRQFIGQMVHRDTAATTTVSLSADGGAPGVTTIMAIPNNSGATFTAMVSALQSTGAGGWKIEGVVYRGANAAATIIQGTTTITTFGIVAGIGAPTVDVIADTTLGGPVISITPANSTATKWVGKLELIQII